MYKNFKLTETEKKQILNQHKKHGYGKPLNEASDITTNMFFKNRGSKYVIFKEVADSIRKIIEDQGISTEGISDEDMILIQNEIKRTPSQDDEPTNDYKLPGYDETMDDLNDLSI
jgi:hypothetical protein